MFFRKSCHLLDNVETFGGDRPHYCACALYAGYVRLHARMHMHKAARLGTPTHTQARERMNPRTRTHTEI